MLAKIVSIRTIASIFDMTKMFFDMWARWDALVHCK
jgi:hypothetical protein